MEGSRNSILSFTAPCKYLPDLSHPRWKRWYSTKTYFSQSTTDLVVYAAPSAQNLAKMTFARRNYADAAAAPARSTSDDMDITTPAYMLAGTNAALLTGDELVGLDYFNPPLNMKQDLEMLGTMNQVDQADSARMFSRVLAINHKFTFINYNKHPVKIYYSMLPTGWTFDDLDAPTTPQDDLSRSSYRSIVIPAVQDQNDRGVTRDLKVSMTMSTIFPEAYEHPPMTRGGALTTEDMSSPWIGTTDQARAYITSPPGQITNFYQTTVQQDKQAPGLNMRFYMQTMSGINVGVPSTTTAAEGLLTTNGVVMMGAMNYLVEHSLVRPLNKAHSGSKAYPLQTA